MFETTGDQAQWRTLYDHLSTMTIGATITDEQLAALIPHAAENSVRNAFWRAVKEMETERSRTFDRVRGVGYRMVDAHEHERLARGQHKKARRRIKAAVRKVHSADRSRLDQATRQRMDAVEMNLAAQADLVKRLSTKVTKVEGAVKAGRREAKADAAALSEKVDRLADLLKRHGIEDPTEATPKEVTT